MGGEVKKEYGPGDIIQICHWCGELKSDLPGPRKSMFAGRCRQPEWHTPYASKAYDPKEQEVVQQTFSKMLRQATGDGGMKREAGLKPPWYKDDSHEAALFSHLNKWKHGELRDGESGSHPLVHLAWRALAIAYQETYGQIDPESAA